MSTKKVLTDAPGSASGEFDVEFGEGELGMRLEERGSFKMLSVVSRVTEDGGCIKQTLNTNSCLRTVTQSL